MTLILDLMRLLVSRWSPLTHTSHSMMLILDLMRLLVSRWSLLTHASHSMTLILDLMRLLVSRWSPLSHASHSMTLILDLMRLLVSRWSPLTHASHSMTTSTPATQTRARVSPAMQPKVFLCWMPFLSQPSIILGLETSSECWLAYRVARIKAMVLG